MPALAASVAQVLQRGTTPSSPASRQRNYVPPESILEALEHAATSGATASEIRGIALREVQRARVPASDKFKLFVPAAQLTNEFRLGDILNAICKESQTQTWDSATPSLCDFVRIRGRGLRFTCTNRDMAIKLGNTALHIMGKQYVIKAFSAFDRLYRVDLTNIPSDLDDEVIFDFFASRSLCPIIAPMHQAGSLMSRDRTAWFQTTAVPPQLINPDGQPLREIFFPGFDSPVYVQHKQRDLNRVVPPSIQAKRRTTQADEDMESNPADPKNDQSKNDQPNRPPAPPARPSTADELLDLTAPEPSEPLHAWLDVTRRGLLASIPDPAPFQTLPTEEHDDEDQLMVFGFPVKATRYELAFAADLDLDLEDIDANVFTAENVNVVTRLIPSPPVGELVASQSMLQVKRTKISRKGFRALAAQTATELLKTPEPETRLGLITAQPLALAKLIDQGPAELDAVVRDHAILRAYSETKSTVHGTSTQLLPRIKHDFPDEIPNTANLLLHVAPDDAARMLAQAYALIDLYFRTHASSIYSDPIKIAAICNNDSPTRLKYSDYLLWSNEILQQLCQSAIGDHILETLPEHIAVAFGMVVNDDNDSIDSSDSASLPSKSPWSLRGLSLNINGLNKPSLHLFQRLFDQYQLIALQETKFHDFDKVKQADYFAHVADSKAQSFWSHHEDSAFPTGHGRAGVGLLLSGRSPFNKLTDVTPPMTSPAFRQHYLLVETRLDTTTFFIHVVYAPISTPDRKEFFSQLPTQFAPDAQHILLGDFNTPIDPILDELEPYPHDLAREELRSWLVQLGVIDAWRHTYPDRRQFTGPNRRNRIDYCFLSNALFTDTLRGISHVTDDKWHHEDHLPVELSLASPDTPDQTQLPWKCPRWILQHEGVQAVLERTLDDLCSRMRTTPGSNPGALLDEHKREDAIFLRQMTRELRRQDSEQLMQLRQTVYDCEVAKNSDQTADSTQAVADAKSALAAFADLLDSRREIAKFDQDVRFGEKGTHVFFRPPSNPEHRVVIPSCRRPDGSVTSVQSDMQQELRQYWGSLFQSPSRDLHDTFSRRHFQPIELQRLLQHTTTRLSDDNQRLLDAPLTARDFYWAIQKSPRGRSSGLDGLPIEYYQLFPSKWARVYEQIYAAQLDRGRMTKFQRRAYISLLYKKGDRSDPGNYRPITLLNHDAKLGPKILAHRLGTVLATLIHPDQTGFVPGRSIRHALLRFQDLQQLCRLNGFKNAGAVLLDFAKAFDSVLWPALEQVLKHFGIGRIFRHAVSTFYSGTLVSVLVNGVKSAFFELGCGVRQGDPLSPALFVLFIEPMLNFLRATLPGFGIPVPHQDASHLVTAFADDCTGLLHDLRYAPKFIAQVRRYADAAGLRLNVSKTQLLPFGSLDFALRLDLEHHGLQVTPDDGNATLLGISQSPTLPHSHRLPRILSQMSARCQLWRFRARTLRGRATILRTIILPLLWYTASVTRIPPAFAHQVENLCKTFVFQLPPNDSPRAPMSSEWLHIRVSRGGLGLPAVTEFSAALHLCALRDAMNASLRLHDAPRWFAPAMALLQRPQDQEGTGFDILFAVIPRTHPAPPTWQAVGEFWYSTLQSWQAIRDSPEHTSAISTMLPFAPLWNNVFFRVGALRRTLSRASSLSRSFRSAGYRRLRDFVLRHSQHLTQRLCTLILETQDFASPRLRSLASSHFFQQLSQWLDLDADIEFGPDLPAAIISASLGWKYHRKLFYDCTNHDLYQLLHHDPRPSTMPHSSLSINEEPSWKSLWRRELILDRDVLPILSDVKFRLQHNGLRTRVKYRWHTSDVDCVHGCPTAETALHLFWDCHLARTVWTEALQPLEDLIQSPIRWEGVVYLQDIAIDPTHEKRIGQHNFLRCFNVIRCCVLRALWIHRNHKLFRPGTTSSFIAVRTHALCYIRLHLKRLLQPDVTNSRLQTLSQAVLDALH